MKVSRQVENNLDELFYELVQEFLGNEVAECMEIIAGDFYTTFTVESDHIEVINRFESLDFN